MTVDARYWDDKYAGHDRLFSGAVNGVLVAEAADLPPGQALDVGCGEGADAHWLARRGWLVTAVDISRTALERAAADGADVADRVSWTEGDPTSAPPPANAFDLVTAQYFPFPRTPGHTALRDLTAAVAPGGTLLFVGHDLTDLPQHSGHGPDPADFYRPAEIAAILGEGWTVEVDETRPRTVPAPPGAHHTHDTVLRARRTG